MQQYDSFFAFIFYLFFKLLSLVDLVSAKLLIHDFNHSVFFMTILLMPSLVYAINTIPLRYTVYSTETIDKLDSYEY